MVALFTFDYALKLEGPVDLWVSMPVLLVCAEITEEEPPKWEGTCVIFGLVPPMTMLALDLTSLFAFPWELYRPEPAAETE